MDYHCTSFCLIPLWTVLLPSKYTEAKCFKTRPSTFQPSVHQTEKFDLFFRWCKIYKLDTGRNPIEKSPAAEVGGCLILLVLLLMLPLLRQRSFIDFCSWESIIEFNPNYFVSHIWFHWNFSNLNSTKDEATLLLHAHHTCITCMPNKHNIHNMLMTHSI